MTDPNATPRSIEAMLEFHDTCAACAMRTGWADDSTTGELFARCDACDCPLKLVSLSRGRCPLNLVAPPPAE